METILAHAQELVSTLLSLMPTPYQKDNLEAMLGLFLEAQGHPLPEHSKTKSASALSRFLNIHRWSTRSCIRTVRNYILVGLRLVKNLPKALTDYFQVMILADTDER